MCQLIADILGTRVVLVSTTDWVIDNKFRQYYLLIWEVSDNSIITDIPSRANLIIAENKGAKINNAYTTNNRCGFLCCLLLPLASSSIKIGNSRGQMSHVMRKPAYALCEQHPRV